jgi:hypothetical protein
MVCVDEVHLFVHFGLTVRKEFTYLAMKLFKELRVGDSKMICKVPIIFMVTATRTKFIVEQVGFIIGFLFDTEHNMF